jgi:carboxypeptidase T
MRAMTDGWHRRVSRGIGRPGHTGVPRGPLTSSSMPPSPRGRSGRACLVGLLVLFILAVLAPMPALAEDEVAPAVAAGSDFPAGYEGYHTVAEENAAVKAIADAHPGIVKRFSIGTSYQGRTLWAAKISDNVQVDENEPEVLFEGLHHAREHMASEMTLAIFRWLTNGYGHDSRITRLVNEREIWIIFIVNPDGAVYDISGGRFHMWRKNRQPTPGSSYIGTDLNRNYGYRWGCCRGSDTWPGSNLYRGPNAWSAPEVRAVRDFVDSRVVGGRQQIRSSISFHTSGRLVMWPYGYTYTDLPADMTQVDHDVLVTLGRKMAATNGYKPEQASDLYISSGTTRDWLYGRYRVLSYTFELTTGWYADDSTIPSETGRNKAAVLDLIDAAACPYGLIGRAEGFCGRFYDDLEIYRGWRVNAAGTDTATDGRWERGDPSPTTSNGPKQLGNAASGQGAFVTGRLAGSTAGANDLDGGLTSVTSPRIAVPGTPPRIRFRYSFAHSAGSSTADLLRLRLVSGATSQVIWTVRGAPVDRDGQWTTATIRIPTAFAGRSVRLVFEAVDGNGDDLVEAALDDIAMMRS